MRYFFFLLTILLVSCNADSVSEDEQKNIISMEVNQDEVGFIHTVFFWMKEDISPDEKSFFEAELEKLGKVSSIYSYHWGKPAETPREVVDNSYDYAWIVHFKDAAAQDAYQVDSIHLAFVENCSELWTKVQVYDTVLE